MEDQRQIKNSFRTLFSFDKSKRCKVWKGWWEHREGDTYIVSIQYGKYGGKLVTKNTLVTKGTQGRSKAEQADLLLDSKTNEKYSDGYKTIQDYLTKSNELGIEIDSTLSVDEIVNIILSNSKLRKLTIPTNKDWIPLPMLAQTFKQKENKKGNGKGHLFPMIAQPKYDGVRCIAIKRGNNIYLMSRQGNYFNLPIIAEQIKELIQIMTEATGHNYIFDGELYNHDLDFERISGITRTGLNKENVQTSLVDDSNFIQYHIYDIASIKLDQTTRIKRLDIAKNVINTKRLESLSIAPSDVVENYYQAISLHNIYVKNKYEGLILRDLYGVYEPGFRSKFLLKLKQFHEDEFVIVGCKVDPKQTIEDSFVFTLRSKSSNSETFNCRPIGTRARKLKYYEEIDNLVGKKAVVRYLDITNTGLPGKAHVKEIRNYE